MLVDKKRENYRSGRSRHVPTYLLNNCDDGLLYLDGKSRNKNIKDNNIYLIYYYVLIHRSISSFARNTDYDAAFFPIPNDVQHIYVQCPLFALSWTNFNFHWWFMYCIILVVRLNRKINRRVCLYNIEIADTSIFSASRLEQKGLKIGFFSSINNLWHAIWCSIPVEHRLFFLETPNL